MNKADPSRVSLFEPRLDLKTTKCAGYCDEELLKCDDCVVVQAMADLEHRALQDQLAHMPANVRASHHSQRPTSRIQIADPEMQGTQKLSLYFYCSDCWQKIEDYKRECRVKVLGADEADSFLPLSLMAERFYPYVYRISIPKGCTTKPWVNEYVQARFDLKKQMAIHIRRCDEAGKPEKAVMRIPESFAVNTHYEVEGMFTLPFYLDMRSFYYFYQVIDMSLNDHSGDYVQHPSPSVALENIGKIKKDEALKLQKRIEQLVKPRNRGRITVTITDVPPSLLPDAHPRIRVHILYDTTKYLDLFKTDTRDSLYDTAREIFELNQLAILESDTNSQIKRITEKNDVQYDSDRIRKVMIDDQKNNTMFNSGIESGIQCLSSMQYQGVKETQTRLLTVNATQNDHFVLMYKNSTQSLNDLLLYEVDARLLPNRIVFPLMVSAHPEDYEKGHTPFMRIQHEICDYAGVKVHELHQLTHFTI